MYMDENLDESKLKKLTDLRKAEIINEIKNFDKTEIITIENTEKKTWISRIWTKLMRLLKMS